METEQRTIAELTEARRLMSTRLTEAQWDGLFLSLAHLYLHGARRFAPTIAGTLQEAHLRRMFLEVTPDED